MDSVCPHPDVSRTLFRKIARGLIVLAGLPVACNAQTAKPPPPPPPPPPPVAVEQQSVLLPGICEPSAAVRGPLDNIWLADDDQNKTLFLWDAAPKYVQRPPPRAIDGVRKKKKKAAVKDIEGLTFDAHNQLWILGSHSRKGNGEFDDKRTRLLSMDSNAPGSAPVITLSLWPQEGDRPEPLVTRLTELCPTCTPDGSWNALNLEGLTLERSTDHLLLGARAPLVNDGKAWLVSVEAKEDGAIKAAYTLELGKRGVRELAPAPDHKGVWIVAGPHTDKDPLKVGFALYSWTGEGPAKLLALLPGFNGSPEGLLPIDTQSAWLFIDEGDRLADAAKNDPTDPHHTQQKGTFKFECGAKVPEGGTQAWAHATRISWPTPDTSAAPIR